MNGIPEHKDMIVFDKLACCAMEYACDTNCKLINELITKLKSDGISEKKIMIWADGFRLTDRLGIVPSMVAEEWMIFHQCLMDAELEKLSVYKNQEAKLPCGHTIKEHKEALEKVRKNLNGPEYNA